MEIVEIKERTPLLIEKLLRVWENSVKATHLFLSADEINSIKEYVPQALRDVPVLAVAVIENGIPAGFMGISGRKLEMLFVASDNRGQGIGKQLLQYGIKTNLPSMNKTLRPEDFTSIRGLRFIKGRNWTSKGIRIRCCI